MSLFRIANCNADNFNVPGVRYAGRPGPDGDPLTEEIYARKVAWLSGLFDVARPDLIGFEELFHADAIAAVVRASRYLHGASVYAPDLENNVAGGEARGPFCGLVTRFPIVAAEAIQDLSGQRERKVEGAAQRCQHGHGSGFHRAIPEAGPPRPGAAQGDDRGDGVRRSPQIEARAIPGRRGSRMIRWPRRSATPAP